MKKNSYSWKCDPHHKNYSKVTYTLSNLNGIGETNMFKTLQEAMQTNLPPVILSKSTYHHRGSHRTILQVRKAKGMRVYMVVQYENELYSSAV